MNFDKVSPRTIIIITVLVLIICVLYKSIENDEGDAAPPTRAPPLVPGVTSNPEPFNITGDKMIPISSGKDITAKLDIIKNNADILTARETAIDKKIAMNKQNAIIFALEKKKIESNPIPSTSQKRDLAAINKKIAMNQQNAITFAARKSLIIKNKAGNNKNAIDFAARKNK